MRERPLLWLTLLARNLSPFCRLDELRKGARRVSIWQQEPGKLLTMTGTLPNDHRSATDPFAGVPGWELWACAQHYLAQHGRDAGVVAAFRCDALREAGDSEGTRDFQAIVRRINGRAGSIHQDALPIDKDRRLRLQSIILLALMLLWLAKAGHACMARVLAGWF